MPDRWHTFEPPRAQAGPPDPPGAGLPTGQRTASAALLRDSWFRLLPVLAVLLLALAFPPAHGQVASPDALIRAGEQAGAPVTLMREVASRAAAAGYSPADVAEILRPAVMAAQKDRPSTPLLNTALEGLSKGVPGGWLRATVQEQRSQLEASGAFVDAWLRSRGQSDRSRTERHQLTESVAQARRQKVPTEDVEALWDTIRDRRLASGRSAPGGKDGAPYGKNVSAEGPQASHSLLVTATDGYVSLRENGLSAGQARSVVSAGVQSDYNAAQLRALVGSVVRQTHKAVRPGVLARSAIRSARRGPAEAIPRRAFAAGPHPGMALSAMPPTVSFRLGPPSQVPDPPPERGTPPGR